MKKRVLLLIILFIFPILVNASTISRDNVSTSTYIIGKYMFTRKTNPSTGYEGGLTTKMIMLASKTLNGDSLSEMIIYYKKLMEHG